MKQQPEKKFRAGAVSATIWKNTSEKGEFSSVQLDRAYKDKDNSWKHTSSFSASDVPKAIVVLNKAYEYLVVKEKEEEPNLM